MPCMIIPLFLPTLVTVETGAKDGGYIHHLILCRGWLWKRSSNTSAVSSIQYRKRFFELSNMALTYTQNEKQTGVIALILYLMYTYYESTACADASVEVPKLLYLNLAINKYKHTFGYICMHIIAGNGEMIDLDRC